MPLNRFNNGTVSDASQADQYFDLLTGAMSDQAVTVANNVTASRFGPSGVTGATAASRYVGATSGGFPASGTFVAGDWGLDLLANTAWLCTGSLYAQTVLADAPVAYWRLDDTGATAVDQQGTYSATFGGTVTKSVSGALTDSDTAVNFSATGYARAVAGLTLPGDFTIECWAKKNGASSNPLAVAVQDHTGWPNSNDAFLYIGDTAVPSAVRLRWASGAVGVSGGTNTQTTNNAWHHVVVTRSGTTVTLYLDGASLTSVTNAGLAGTLAATEIVLGAAFDNTTSPVQNFTGSLDEVAVYNWALPAARVSAHYSAASNTSPFVFETIPSPPTVMAYGAKGDAKTVDDGVMDGGLVDPSSANGLGAPFVAVQATALTTPVNAPFFSSTTGGSLAGGTTYYYRVTAFTGLGETLASTETSIAVPAGTSTNTVTVQWGLVQGANGYKIYGRSTGAELLIGSVSEMTTLSFVDDGSVTPSGALPGSNTTITSNLPAGTYTFAYTLTNSHGETKASPTNSVTITANQAILFELAYQNIVRTLNATVKIYVTVAPGGANTGAVGTGVHQIADVVFTYGTAAAGDATSPPGTNTTGSNTAVLTSATAAFQSSDVGKKVVVAGAGTTAAHLNGQSDLFTTISSVQSATQVTLAASCGNGVTGARVCWGTDDGAAIQKAIDAVNTAGGGQVLVLGPNKYLLDSTAHTVTVNGLYAAYAVLIRTGVELVGVGGPTLCGPGWPGADTNLIVDAGRNGTTNHFAIRRIKFDGNHYWSEAGQSAIQLSYCSDWEVTDCEDVNFGSKFLSVARLPGQYAQRFRVARNYGHERPGNWLGFSGAKSFIVEDNTYYFTTTGAGTECMIFSDCHQFQVVDNRIIWGGNFALGNQTFDDGLIARNVIQSTPDSVGTNQAAIALTGVGAGRLTQRIEIVDNLIDTTLSPASNSIQVEAQSSGSIQSVTVARNTINAYDSTRRAIYVYVAGGTAVSDVDVFENRVITGAIYVLNATDVRVLNNRAPNGGVTFSGTTTGSVARGNKGYNPVGSVTTPSFPATTVAATNTLPVDVDAYVTNGVGALTVQIDSVTSLMVIPASAVALVRIPAGSTFTPTYGSGSPSWKWYGN